MKILAVPLLFLPFAISAQNVGIHTLDPQHPLQINVDSAFTDTVQDLTIPLSIGISAGLAITPGSQKGAQSITVGQTGYLAKLTLYFALPTVADEILIEVFRGAGPEGTLMTSATLYDQIIGAATITFSNPWQPVTEGEIINIVMTPIAGASCKWKSASFDYVGGSAHHYAGNWAPLEYDLGLSTFVEYSDTVAYPVLSVRDDRKVMINDYALPRYDGAAGDVLQTNGDGNVTWLPQDQISGGHIIMDADADTRVDVEQMADEDIIRFKTNGMERMTILQNGKVGLNATAPVSDLDIRGNNDVEDGGEMQLATPSMSNFIRMFGGRQGDPHPFLAFHDTDTFHLVTSLPDWSTYTRRMTITPIGRVGIGIDRPLSKLDIKALGDGAEVLRFTTDRPWVFKQSLTGINTNLDLQSINNDKAFQIVSENGTNRAARFFTNNTYSKVLLVPDGGEVGIGISEAAAKLHVRHNSTTSDTHLRLTETSVNDFVRIKFDNESEPGIFWDLAARSDTSASESRLNFYYSNPGFTGDKMTILGNGNVGIGTSSPLEKFHVVGDMRVSGLSGTGDRNVIVDSNGKLKIGTSGIGGWLETATQVSTTLEVYVDSPSGATSSVTIDGRASNGNNFSALSIYNNTQFPGGTYNRLLIDANDLDAFSGSGSPIHENLSLQRQSSGNLLLTNGGGKVGIGTLTPASKLSVHGDENDGTNATVEIKSTSGAQRMIIDGNELDVVGGTLFINSNSGNRVSIGSSTAATGYKLSVGGKIMAEEIRVQLAEDWPDYVFEEDYPLMPLMDVNRIIKEQGHLPGMPSASVVAADGILLGDMQRIMVEKIEELTLHVISLHQRISVLEKENTLLKEQAHD